MLMIRLQRVGRKNDPSYRVVLTDKQNAPQSGKFKEILGSYDPRKDKPELKAERIEYWIDKGAQPSETMHNLLIDEGIIKGDKINVLPQKTPVVKEEEEKDLPVQAGEATAEEPKEEETEEPTPETKEEEPVEDTKGETLTEEVKEEPATEPEPEPETPEEPKEGLPA